MFGINSKNIVNAYKDIRDGAICWRVWHILSVQDIKQRYRRSTFGPWWLTISTGIQVMVVGITMGVLLGQPIQNYLPYVCGGFLLWNFMSTVATEGSMCFISAAPHLMQIRRPLFAFALQVIWRNYINLFHASFIFVGVAAFCGINPWPAILLAPIGLLLLLFNLSWSVVLFGLLSARFRDIPMIIQNAISVMFWVTPVAYYPTQLGAHQYLITFNPLGYLINVVRLPLLGEIPGMDVYLIVIAIGVVGWIGTFLSFARFRGRVTYWI
ncbi:MAG: ABC transporter permease [Phaeospirillum sp.]|nr:ABC transporter permease [Phaeospirillum sp.]